METTASVTMERGVSKNLWVRTFGGLALSALSVILFTLAFPPYDIWPLIWVGLVPMLLAQHRIMPRSLSSGLAQGVGIGGFFWGYFDGMFSGGGSWFMRWLPLMIGLISAISSADERSFHERTAYRWFVPQGAVVWVGIEMIRMATGSRKET